MYAPRTFTPPLRKRIARWLRNRENILSLLAIALAGILPLVIGTNEIAYAAIGLVLLALIALAIYRTEHC